MASLKRNIAYNFAYQLMILLLPLVTAPYLARVIGAVGVGSYSYTYTVATYFVYFVKLGLDNYGNRTIASVRNGRSARSRCFCSIYALQIICFFIASSAYAAYLVFFAEDKLLSLIQGVYLLSSLFDINWFFFGLEKFSMTVTRNTLVKLGTTALIFLLVKNRSDIWIYTLIMCTGFLVSQLALWPFMPKYVDFALPTFREIRSHIKPNLILFVSVIAISVYNTMSKLMLGATAGVEQVGYFENAAKLVSVPTALINAVGTVMLPRMSALLAGGSDGKAKQYIDRTLYGVMAFAGISMFGIMAVSTQFVLWFYGPGYGKTAQCLIALSCTIPILGFGNVIRTQYLIPTGRDSIFLMSAFCGAVVSVSANVLLISRFGCVGSAVASVAAETAVLSYQLFAIRDRIPITKYLGSALFFLLCGLGMFVILRVLLCDAAGFSGIALTVGVGFLCYFALVSAGIFIGSRIRERLH